MRSWNWKLDVLFVFTPPGKYTWKKANAPVSCDCLHVNIFVKMQDFLHCVSLLSLCWIAMCLCRQEVLREDEVAKIILCTYYCEVLTNHDVE